MIVIYHGARNAQQTWQNPSSALDAGMLLSQAVDFLPDARIPQWKS